MEGPIRRLWKTPQPKSTVSVPTLPITYNAPKETALNSLLDLVVPTFSDADARDDKTPSQETDGGEAP